MNMDLHIYVCGVCVRESLNGSLVVIGTYESPKRVLMTWSCSTGHCELPNVGVGKWTCLLEDKK